MKFLQYIESRINDEEEFDVIIGNVDMPTTLCFNNNWKITDYCKERYKGLLNSEVIIHKDPTGYCTTSVEVLFDDYEIGEEFCMAVAGYISQGEWEKLFIEGGVEDDYDSI